MYNNWPRVVSFKCFIHNLDIIQHLKTVLKSEGKWKYGDVHVQYLCVFFLINHWLRDVEIKQNQVSYC